MLTSLLRAYLLVLGAPSRCDPDRAVVQLGSGFEGHDGFAAPDGLRLGKLFVCRVCSRCR